MQALFPEASGELDDAALLERYGSDQRPFVRFNFVSSLDGSAQIDGLSGGLGTPADARVFALLRRLASVILVGAGTVRAEGYDGELLDEAGQRWREERGLDSHPALAIISRELNIDPQAKVLDSDHAPVLLFTGAQVSPQVAARYPGHVELIQVGLVHGNCDARQIVAELSARSLHFIHSEGGPRVFGQFVTQGVLDSLCLSFSPLLAAGDGLRITSHAPETKLALPLHSVLHEKGMLLTDYRRDATRPTSAPASAPTA